MKKLLFILLALLPLASFAQKWLKKMRPIQVAVVVYDAKGEMHQGQGVRVGQGELVLTEYDLLRGASKVVISDMAGVDMPVTELCGANSLYNVAKLTTGQNIKKFTEPEFVADALNEGSVVYIMPLHNADKKASALVDTIRKAETFKEQYHYYTLNGSHDARYVGAAVMTSGGQLVGILQSASKAGEPSVVIDARFVSDLTISALSANNSDLISINLPLAMPDTEEQASTFLMLADRTNKARFTSYLDRFIARYPKSTVGYTTKAEFLAQDGAFAQADSVYEQGLSVEGVARDELLYSRSVLAYDLCRSGIQNDYPSWTDEYALQQVQSAYAMNPLPLYTMHEAKCLYALKQYEQAFEKFISLGSTNMRSPDVFISAAVCRQALNVEADDSLMLAAMDSAVCCFNKPYPQAASPYLYARAEAYAKAGKYRNAVLDLNEYERLNLGNLSLNFYYKRQQYAVLCRMYSAALSDLESVMALAPEEPVYCAEAASLSYRVGEIDDAIQYAERAVALDPEFADAYRILGVCYKQNGNKAKARTMLKRAKDLGDDLAEGILNELN